MPNTRFGANQVIDRLATMFTADFGSFDLVEVGEIANATSTANLPSGQMVATGQVQATDITCSVMFADDAQVARITAWKNATDAGGQLPNYKQKDVQILYYGENGLPRAAVTIEEAFVHTVNYPATNQDGAGAGARLTFMISAFNAKALFGAVS